MSQFADELHGSAPQPEPEEQPEQPAAKKPGSRWGRRVGWFMAMAAVGVVVGLVIVSGMKFIDGPVSASGQTITLAQAKATPAPVKQVQQLSGLYISLAYPGLFDRVSQVKNDRHSLEQYNLSSSSDYSRTIAVDVAPLESGNLNDDSSFRVRILDPTSYKEVQTKVGGEPAVIFNKDTTESTLFWAHRGKMVSVAITTNNPKDSVGAFMKAITPTMRWVQ